MIIPYAFLQIPSVSSATFYGLPKTLSPLFLIRFNPRCGFLAYILMLVFCSTIVISSFSNSYELMTVAAVVSCYLPTVICYFDHNTFIISKVFRQDAHSNFHTATLFISIIRKRVFILEIQFPYVKLTHHK
ncbi:hypothetical protein ACTXT7_012486 [Hymenolepis weldensis]